jgi:small subunit ribosomal protein S1
MTDHQAPEESSPLEAVGDMNGPAVSDGGEDAVAASAVGTAATGETEEAVAVAEGIVSAEDLEITAEELDRLYEESLKHIQEGEIVRGRVVQIGRDSVLVDVGYKSEGVIDLDEFPDRGRDLAIGEELDVLLEQKEDSEGQVILSK